MNTEVASVGASIVLHYEIKEDLLNLGAVADKAIRLDVWGMGNRKDIFEAILNVLSKDEEGAVFFFGVVPQGEAPSDEPQESREEPEEASGYSDEDKTAEAVREANKAAIMKELYDPELKINYVKPEEFDYHDLVAREADTFGRW